VRKQRVFLEHHADAPFLRRQAQFRRRHHRAVQQDAARGGRFESGDTSQHCGFAAAAGAEQAADAAARQRKRQPAHRLMVFIGVLEVLDLKLRVHALHSNKNNSC